MRHVQTALSQSDCCLKISEVHNKCLVHGDECCPHGIEHALDMQDSIETSENKNFITLYVGYLFSIQPII